MGKPQNGSGLAAQGEKPLNLKFLTQKNILGLKSLHLLAIVFLWQERPQSHRLLAKE